MYHYGDITKINGAEVPVVDTIIFGAPCQDLSVAGKRAGMKHGDLGDEEATRSGLFMEAVRIIKEMRKRDEYNGRTGINIRPRYGIYENVPGAFSSNKGEDFRIVLEELAKVKDPNAVVPMPEKWTNNGCIVGDGWSIAWRILDAQFWGVPQRRRRIALVADFGGESAPEILFVSQSVSRDTEPSKSKREATPSDATRGFGADDRQCVTFEPGIASREGGHIYEGVSGTLRAHAGDNQMATAYSVENHPNDSRVGINEDGKVQALTSRMGTGGGNVPMVMQCDKSFFARQAIGEYKDSEVASAIRAVDYKDVTDIVCAKEEPAVVYALDRASFNQGKNAQYDFEVSDKGVNSPIVAKGPGAVCYSVDQGGGKSSVDVREGKAPTLTTTHDGSPAVCYSTAHGSFHTIAEEGICATLQATDYKDPPTAAYRCGTRYIVRRLTPLECERLQGYPDGWTDIGEYIDTNGKKRQASDAARYKALGNSIALPPWKWVLKRICACYERDATMASLFDGIGGFPYLWEQLNGKGTCLWASEIEEFPIAVTKVRIGGNT